MKNWIPLVPLLLLIGACKSTVTNEELESATLYFPPVVKYLDRPGYSFDNVERQKALRSYKDYGDTLFELVIDREGRVKKARILRTHVKRHNHEFMLEHANDFRFTKDTEDRYRAFYYPTNYTLELDYREQ